LVFEADVAGKLLRVVAAQKVRRVSLRRIARAAAARMRTHLTKLCQRTPVGSLSTRTKAVTSTSSPSIVARLWPSWGVCSLRRSAKRVKPQSHSSLTKRWWASVVVARADRQPRAPQASAIPTRGPKRITQGGQRHRQEDARDTVKIDGSLGFEIASANWAQACQPSGADFGLA
jgi:hypothetical protein